MIALFKASSRGVAVCATFIQGGNIVKILKFICAILSCVMVMLLPGCSSFGRIPTRVKMLDSEVSNMERSNLEITKDVLNCFSQKDSKSLKALLCAKTQGLTDIDEQILVGFDLFKGRVTSFNEDVLGYEGKSSESGKSTLLERYWNIKDIVTDAGGSYEILINTYIIYEKDKNRVGISQITITSSDGTKLKIGYEWPSYYNEGRDMSNKVIKALSEKDIDGLKSIICAKTLEIVDIDAQIQEGLSFFEGKATRGKVKGKNIVYDGKHDYRTSVSEDEIVKNNKPTRTSITVFNQNIETDANKIYKIDFNAYILYTGDESRKGISQIILTSDDGRKQVIGERLD